MNFLLKILKKLTWKFSKNCHLRFFIIKILSVFLGLNTLKCLYMILMQIILPYLLRKFLRWSYHQRDLLWEIYGRSQHPQIHYRWKATNIFIRKTLSHYVFYEIICGISTYLGIFNLHSLWHFLLNNVYIRWQSVNNWEQGINVFIRCRYRYQLDYF